ncbi:relaxase/mobilization nuclease domain-containing protein [Priestia aryabhattai]|uniref:Relaxase/mobilization nuclease domain-containing protein n=1 Tax=Priestia aryabhattai TaxID=412384 RepID=A0ABD5L351_PRIAR
MATIKLSTTKNANALLKYAEKRAEVSNSVDCDVDYARNQFKATREIWGKNGGIQAHHVIQSFKPNEVDAQTANEIGKQLAEKLAKGHEVAIYTHTDKNHIHNHIIINAVNFEDGRKYHAHGQEAIEHVRKISDKLCRERGLSVIEERSAEVRYTLAEQSLLQKGESSWKDEIRTAIDKVKEQTHNFDSFQKVLEEQGVKTTVRGKNITYEHLESNKKVRGNKLGLAYEKETILNGFERQVTGERESACPTGNESNKGSQRELRRDGCTAEGDRRLSLNVPQREYGERNDDAAGARTDQEHKQTGTVRDDLDLEAVNRALRERNKRAQEIYRKEFGSNGGRDKNYAKGIIGEPQDNSERTREDQQQPGEQVRRVKQQSSNTINQHRKTQQEYDREF